MASARVGKTRSAQRQRCQSKEPSPAASDSDQEEDLKHKYRLQDLELKTTLGKRYINNMLKVDQSATSP